LLSLSRVQKLVCFICNQTTVKGTKEASISMWCAPGHTPSDLIKCVKGCGTVVHPACNGFSDASPPPDPWTCPLCESAADDFV
jgi:hypothetical protein